MRVHARVVLDIVSIFGRRISPAFALICVHCTARERAEESNFLRERSANYTRLSRNGVPLLSWRKKSFLRERATLTLRLGEGAERRPRISLFFFFTRLIKTARDVLRIGGRFARVARRLACVPIGLPIP